MSCDMMLINLIVGVITSVLSAFIFIFLMKAFKIHIDISDKIALSGETLYIKVLNMSSRSAFDIKAKLHMVTLHDVSNGKVKTHHVIRLVTDEIFMLSKNEHTNEHEDYGWRFKWSRDDMARGAGNDEFYLKFHMHTKDSLTGLGKLYTKTYDINNGNTIVSGEFEYGNSMNIKENT